MIDVPVLIVGGGPVGLTASILLSQHGIRSLLAERHPGTAVLPKARGINARTMEMYRQCGVDQEIRDAGLPVERTGLIVWTKTLAGEEIERRVPGRATAQNMAVTPVRNCLCAQDYLEPVLRRFAERLEPGQTHVQRGGDGRRAGRPSRDRHPHRPSERRRDPRARAVRDRGRWHPERHPPHAGRHHDRPRGGVRQRQYPLQRRSAGVDGAPAGRPLLRRAAGPAGHVSDHQCRGSLGLPRAQPERVRIHARALHRRAVDRADPPGRRRARSRREYPRRELLGGLGARGRPVRSRAHLPGRRRRARDAADGRIRPQYRRAGRAEPRVEARGGLARPGECVAARHLPRGAAAAGRGHHRGEPRQFAVDGPDRAPARRRAAAPRVPQRAGPDLRRLLRVRRR